MSDRTTLGRPNRRRFLGAIALSGCAAWRPAWVSGAERPPLSERPKANDHTLVTIAGTPRERGRQYGERFTAEIPQFLEKEIFTPFTGPNMTSDRMLRYAAACLKPIRELSSTIADEMEGMAEGSGRRLEEIALITMHEELWHRSDLPPLEHCTAVAVGPPTTNDQCTYVAQSWDWMESVYGKSQMVLWQRGEGPSVLAYSYPGLWVGAGMNSAGIALCWTSAGGSRAPGLKVGLPAYVLLTHLLYQPTLDAVEEEARRAGRAGWFTFVMADGAGQLLNVEGSPEKIATKRARGVMARVNYGLREMTGTPPDKPVPLSRNCKRMTELVAASTGKIDRSVLQGFFGDHEGICKHFSTLDVMVYNTTRREAYVSRGPGCPGRWQRFAFFT